LSTIAAENIVMLELAIRLCYTAMRTGDSQMSLAIYTAIVATVSAGAAIFSLIKFWPRLTVTVALNAPRSASKPVLDINIHNGKRHLVAIAKTGLHLADGSENSRDHCILGNTTTLRLASGADYSEQWQLDFDQETKYAWALDIYGNRYSGGVPKKVTQRIKQVRP
jgi:hypothetical protein